MLNKTTVSDDYRKVTEADFQDVRDGLYDHSTFKTDKSLTLVILDTLNYDVEIVEYSEFRGKKKITITQDVLVISPETRIVDVEIMASASGQQAVASLHPHGSQIYFKPGADKVATFICYPLRQPIIGPDGHQYSLYTYVKRKSDDSPKRGYIRIEWQLYEGLPNLLINEQIRVISTGIVDG